MRFTRLFFLLIAVLCLITYNLATASANTIRLVYFLPSDRTPQSDINSKIDTLITGVQTVYADRMKAAGHSRKTFTFETNTDGTAKVHHITGERTDAYYETANKWDIWDELRLAGFDPETDICIVFADLSIEHIDGWCGTDGDWLANFGDNDIWKSTGGGVVTLTASGECFNGEYGKHIAVHELGHALGLRHDFRGDPTIDYATGQDPMVTSTCALKWLDGHANFNSNLGASTEDTTIELATPYFLTSGLTFEFTMTDADGLHQAQFFKFVEATGGYQDLHLLTCESLSGSPRTVRFETTSITPENNTVALRVMDDTGSSTEQHFSVDFSVLSPPPQSSQTARTESTLYNPHARPNADTRGANSTDVNADGIVNIQDLVLVASNLGAEGENQADVNGDGVVNILDLVSVASAFKTE